MPNDPKSVTGGKFANTGDAFKVATPNVLVGFDMLRAHPDAPQYITVDDFLAIQLAAPGATGTLTVNLRILTPDGKIMALSFSAPTVNSRVLGFKTFPLLEGFLISAEAVYSAAVTATAPCYAIVGLARNPLTAQAMYTVLCAGYVTSVQGLAYPQYMPQRMTDGPGLYHRDVQGAPAATSEIIFTIPAGARYRIASLFFSLTTSAVAGNRVVNTTLDDGANIYFQSPTQGNQAASLTVGYCAADSLSPYTNPGNVNMMPLPGNLVMPAGHRIRTVTTAMQAGDQYTAMQLLVADWNESL